MFDINKQYATIIRDICETGTVITTRNGKVKRLTNLRVECTSTPLISIRTTAWRNAIKEMEWFISGSDNINDLAPSVRHWWRPWADNNGRVAHNYGSQFRHCKGHKNDGDGFDQIDYIIDILTHNTGSRRAVISAWNTADMVDAPITNCHATVVQCFIQPDNKLDMTMYQRSSDVMVGLPHNLIQYWALLQWLAYKSCREVGKFTWLGGDCHIYDAHMECAKEIITLDEFAQYDEVGPSLLHSPHSDGEFRAEDFALDKEYAPILTTTLPLIV